MLQQLFKLCLISIYYTLCFILYANEAFCCCRRRYFPVWRFVVSRHPGVKLFVVQRKKTYSTAKKTAGRIIKGYDYDYFA